MLYSCNRIKEICICKILLIDIKWKDIVLGCNGNNNVNVVRNHIFTIITFSLYSMWVKYHQPDSKINFMNVNIKHALYNYILYYSTIFKSQSNMFLYHNIFSFFNEKILEI